MVHLLGIQSFLNSAIACGQLPSYLGVHSKPSVVLGQWEVLLPHKTPETRKVFEFFCISTKKYLKASLV